MKFSIGGAEDRLGSILTSAPMEQYCNYIQQPLCHNIYRYECYSKATHVRVLRVMYLLIHMFMQVQGFKLWFHFCNKM